ncbi:MAG: hypothetical protein B6243_11825 [Anaerolineaceae bacterium 4572_5.2]|nr:MAG: hypothetical protein B6243_11825 [Anaerolineaceae bacterium 4572_5.2]
MLSPCVILEKLKIMPRISANFTDFSSNLWQFVLIRGETLVITVNCGTTEDNPSDFQFLISSF